MKKEVMPADPAPMLRRLLVYTLLVLAGVAARDSAMYVARLVEQPKPAVIDCAQAQHYTLCQLCDVAVLVESLK
jgi:hypothetical protein